MTAEPVIGDVFRLDVRDLEDRQAVGVLQNLLDNPPDDLLGLLVVDTVEGLGTHERLFERLGTSRQVEKALVVAVGELTGSAGLLVPASLRREFGPIVLWIGNPVGSKWRLGATTAARLTKPSPEKALTRLLGVLEIPEIYEALRRLPAPPAVSPGLSMLGDGDDEDAFLHALSRALTRFQRDRDDPGQAQEDVRLAVEALQAVVAPPGALPEILPDGRFDRASTAVRRSLAHLAAETTGLSTLASLVTAGRSVGRVASAAASLAEALAAQRDACAALPEGVQTPGGAVQPAAVSQRCQDYGLRLRPVSRPDTAPGRIVGDQVSSWVKKGVCLADVDGRLQQLERSLGTGLPDQYREQVLRTCPEAFLQRLRRPAPFPSPPPVLFPAALAAGLLAGFAGGGADGVTAAVVILAALVWSGLLLNWPATGLGRLGFSLIAGLVVIGGGGLAYLGAKATEPPVGIAALAGLFAIPATVLALATMWRNASTEWVEGLGIQESETAETRIVTHVNRLVSEWAASRPRNEALDTVILARSMTAGLQAAAAAALADLEPRGRASRAPERRGDYRTDVTHEQLRAVAVAAMDPLWDHLTDHRPQALQRDVQSDLERALRAWLNGTGDPLLRVPTPKRGRASTPQLTADALDAVVKAATTDANVPMWQPVLPDDLSRLSLRAQDVGVIRFAPALVKNTAPGSWSAELTPLTGSAAAGVLRLVPLREGVARMHWPDTVDLRTESGPPVVPPSADTRVDVVDDVVGHALPTNPGELA